MLSPRGPETLRYGGASLLFSLGSIAGALFLFLAGPLEAGAHAASRSSASKAYTFDEGVASWYGGKFHGRQTASGKRYDKNGLSAAHRTLPFGTILLVTNLDNGRSVRLEVNDRGPFVGKRILDCSEGAAKVLGYHGAGLANVRLEIIGQLPSADDSRLSRKQKKRLERALAKAARKGRELELRELGGILSPSVKTEGRFAVQVGAFATRDNAVRLRDSLKEEGHGCRVVAGADHLHRVQVGPFGNEEAADAASVKLSARGLPAWVLRVD